MAQRNFAETLTGAVVLVIAGGFLAFAIAHSGERTGRGYPLTARFQRIDGLGVGADVRVAGVKIGSVTATAIDPKSFEAVVTFTVAEDIKLPTDSGAVITSDGLLGGKYLALSPGGDDHDLAPGGVIKITQSSINIEDLLGKFVFSMANMSNTNKPDGKDGSPDGGGGDGGGKP